MTETKLTQQKLQKDTEREKYIQKMKFSIISSNRVLYLKYNLYNFSMEKRDIS